MKILSLWQPWATLMAIGAKTIETRSWATRHRGLIAIHAAKAFPKEGKDLIHGDVDFQYPLRERFDLDGSPSQLIAALPLGKIVAVGELITVQSTESVFRGFPWLDRAQERAYGNYEPGRYGWVFENVRPLREPLPYKGGQGLRNLDPATAQKVRGLL